VRAEYRTEATTLPLFRALAAAQIDSLLQHASMQRYPRGALLFEEGDPADFLHILIEGTVELFATSAGQEAAVTIAWPPECFILAAALTGEPYLMSARTLGSSRILTIRAVDLRDAMHRDNQLALNATALLAGQFRMAVRQIKDLKLRAGAQRLAAFLMRLVDETGSSGTADLPVPKVTLASRLGITPESLSRAFATLRQHGLEISGSHVTIVDRDRLEQYCAPNALIDAAEGPLEIVRDQGSR
jgi:CRP/FNR family transcriptional regulator, transcriptional activator FtrB